jgi:hypothetical protein
MRAFASDGFCFHRQYEVRDDMDSNAGPVQTAPAQAASGGISNSLDSKAPAPAPAPAAAPKPASSATPAAKTFTNTSSSSSAAAAKPARPPRDAFIFQKQNGKVLVKEPGSLEFPG